MKFRSDFVSNSSSCSFVIETAFDIKKAVLALNNIIYATEETDYFPYDEEVRVHFNMKKKDVVNFGLDEEGHNFTFYPEPKKTYNSYADKYECPADDDDIEVYNDLSYFCAFARGHEGMLDKISHLSFSVEDYDEGRTGILHLLKVFFEHEGVNTDDSETEISFGKSGFRTMLLNKITQKENKQ